MRAFLICIFVAACYSAEAQKQGVCGKVLWVEGNQMPAPDRKTDGGKGIARKILIYEAVTKDQVSEHNGFYREIPARLIATGRSNKKGFFRISLPPGKYSLFVEEPHGLFARTFDVTGAINPIRIDAGKFYELTIRVDYKAAY